MGFLVYFLSYFVLLDFLSDCLNIFVFALAELLLQVETVQLGLLFLGYIYSQLDNKRLLGRYNVMSMVHTTFLAVYLFEHFPVIAPSLSTDLPQDREHFLIDRWSRASTHAWLIRYRDRQAYFIPSPYAGATFLPVVEMTLVIAPNSNDAAWLVVDNYVTIALATCFQL